VSLVYFDSSALVKLVVEEDGSDTASALWDGCDAALSTRLAYPEVRAALAAAHRNRDMDDDAYLMATDEWEAFWGAVRPVELTATVARHAGELAHRHALRGADAIHLAGALAVDSGDVIIAVWERRLHAGATAEQLLVAPATLPR
jgi:predicted nucleic acid-binding protein